MNNPTAKECVILVPCGEAIAVPCEQALRVLEERGYTVRRVRGFSQIDVARNCIASTAIQEGFAETLWIDSDMGFDPDDVEKLRAHQLPVVCGIYAKKGKREFTCKFLPDTRRIQFGKSGGLLEIMYAATGFLYVKRQVYLDMQSKLKLPVCNTMFGESVTPWFQPMVRDYQNGHWYLSEDFAFSERIRQAGYKIFADTTVRLMHYETTSSAGKKSVATSTDSLTTNSTFNPTRKPPTVDAMFTCFSSSCDVLRPDIRTAVRFVPCARRWRTPAQRRCLR